MIKDRKADYSWLTDMEPIHTIIENLSKLASVARPGTVVTDVGSTKSAITRHAHQVLGDGLTFIGGHPMAGSEVSGVAAADAYLYENAVWVLTPTEESPEVERLASLAQMVGARVVITDPERHDRIAARISHLPQTLAIALMNLSGSWNDDDDLTLRLAAGGFRDLTRIASSPCRHSVPSISIKSESILTIFTFVRV